MQAKVFKLFLDVCALSIDRHITKTVDRHISPFGVKFIDNR